jgi:Adenylate and Guanylate cyclase catalytic domain
MAKFANSCRQKFNALVTEMVTQLGPDTRDLRLRIGLHSGPVTAGVLRGQKLRFQLFGDTVNTASRMESNGVPNKIHASLETAKLLADADKGHWATPRDSLVHAKGKGSIHTYWLEPTSIGPGTETTISNDTENGTHESTLVDWASDVILSLTKQVKNHHVTVSGEVNKVTEIPHYSDVRAIQETASIELSESVKKEIGQFVLAISLTYRGMCPLPANSSAICFCT